MAETVYCDDYEDLVGKKPKVQVTAKVITVAEETPIFNATKAETKAK